MSRGRSGPPSSARGTAAGLATRCWRSPRPRPGIRRRRGLTSTRRQAPVLGRDPRAFWANYRRSDEVIDRLDAGLAQAGLDAARQATRAPATPWYRAMLARRLI